MNFFWFHLHTHSSFGHCLHCVIMLGTRGATLHAFRGDTGKSLPNFPIKLSGAVTASPIVTRLREDTVGLQVYFSRLNTRLQLCNLHRRCKCCK